MVDVEIIGHPKSVPGMGWTQTNFPRNAEGIQVGETNVFVEVQCVKKQNGDYYSITKIRIELWIVISVDQGGLERWNKLFPQFPKTPEGTYGHEQRHVVAIRDWLRKEGAQMLRNKFGSAYQHRISTNLPASQECDKRIKAIKTGIETLLHDEIIKFAHGGERDSGVPAPDTQYDPLDGASMPENPSPYPAGKPVLPIRK